MFTNEKYPPPGARPVFARFQMLKPSSIKLSFCVSSKRMVRVIRVSVWKTAASAEAVSRETRNAVIARISIAIYISADLRGIAKTGLHLGDAGESVIVEKYSQQPVVGLHLAEFYNRTHYEPMTLIGIRITDSRRDVERILHDFGIVATAGYNRSLIRLVIFSFRERVRKQQLRTGALEKRHQRGENRLRA